VDAVSPLLLAAEETPPSAPRIGRARPFFFFFFFFFFVFFAVWSGHPFTVSFFAL